jgi:hypothetical protein
LFMRSVQHPYCTFDASPICPLSPESLHIATDTMEFIVTMVKLQKTFPIGFTQQQQK